MKHYSAHILLNKEYLVLSALLDLMTRSGLDADDATEKMKKDIFYRFDPRVSWPWFAERPASCRNFSTHFMPFSSLTLLSAFSTV